MFMVCPYFVPGTVGCGADGKIIDALAGEVNEGGNIFYQDIGDKKKCMGEYNVCNTFIYVSKLSAK